jgi:hypothetical protein
MKTKSLFSWSLHSRVGTEISTEICKKKLGRDPPVRDTQEVCRAEDPGRCADTTLASRVPFLAAPILFCSTPTTPYPPHSEATHLGASVSVAPSLWPFSQRLSLAEKIPGCSHLCQRQNWKAPVVCSKPCILQGRNLRLREDR